MTPEAPSPGVDPWTHEGALYGAGGEYGNIVDAFRRVSVLDSPVVTLDEEQQKALDLVMSGKNMFITGVGGTGKSVMLKEIKKKLEEKGKVVAVTAPTGLAAEAIEGCTIHAAAGIGVPENINGFGFLKRIHISRIKNYDVLMIDEVSMISGEFMDRLSEHFAKAREHNAPFGGLQIILFGDFLQLGPIDNTNERHKTGRGFCPALFLNRGWAFQGWEWKKLKLQFVELKKVYRQQDKAFVEVLRDIRMGKMNAVQTLEKLIDAAQSCRDSLQQQRINLTSTTLVSTNKEADTYNKHEIMKLQGNPRYFACKDKVEVDEGISYEHEPDARRQLESQGVPKTCRVPKTLELKTATQVMMLKNMEVDIEGEDTPRKLVNGSRGQVTGFAEIAGLLPELEKRRAELVDELKKLPKDDITSHERDSLNKRIQRIDCQIEWTKEQQEGVQLRHNEKAITPVVPLVQWHSFPHNKPSPVFPEDFTFSTAGLGKNIRSQIPLMLAWTITMHKAQGMTLSSVRVYAENIFADGQLYVGLSRAKSVASLTVSGLSKAKVMAAPTAKLFHENPEGNIEQRWWHRNRGLEHDNQHKVLDRLITHRKPHQDERTLSMDELKEKYDGEDRVAPCEVCRLKLQCCFDVKDTISRTIKKTIGKRVREDSGAGPSGQGKPKS